MYINYGVFAVPFIWVHFCVPNDINITAVKQNECRILLENINQIKVNEGQIDIKIKKKNKIKI